MEDRVKGDRGSTHIVHQIQTSVDRPQVDDDGSERSLVGGGARTVLRRLDRCSDQSGSRGNRDGVEEDCGCTSLSGDREEVGLPEPEDGGIGPRVATGAQEPW